MFYGIVTICFTSNAKAGCSKKTSKYPKQALCVTADGSWRRVGRCRWERNKCDGGDGLLCVHMTVQKRLLYRVQRRHDCSPLQCSVEKSLKKDRARGNIRLLRKHVQDLVTGIT
jgi:hypothetical protein